MGGAQPLSFGFRPTAFQKQRIDPRWREWHLHQERIVDTVSSRCSQARADSVQAVRKTLPNHVTHVLGIPAHSIRTIAASSSSLDVTSPLATSAAWSVASIHRVSSARPLMANGVPDRYGGFAVVPRRA
jgi:hypothetical protein